MKIGLFITARLGSTRLPRKHLLPVKGRPLIHFLLKRIQAEFQNELAEASCRLAVVTSDEPENRAFEQFCAEGVAVFYGSKSNIPFRHLQAARALAVDAIVSIDGDDILCSVKGMRSVYDALAHDRPYVKTANLPFGMNSGGYSRDFLESSLIGRTDDVLETGWSHIFDATKLKELSMTCPVQNDSLRFTLDYQEDFQFFTAVIESIGEAVITAPDELIVSRVLDEKLYLITEPIMKQYWENFYRLQAQEKLKSHNAG